MIRFDIRDNGFGIVYDGKSELLIVDLNVFLEVLRERIVNMKLHISREDYRDFVNIPMPKGHPKRHIFIDNKGGYGVHMGYTEKDGTKSFGGISKHWPRDIDDVMQTIEKLIEKHNNSKYWNP